LVWKFIRLGDGEVKRDETGWEAVKDALVFGTIAQRSTKLGGSSKRRGGGWSMKPGWGGIKFALPRWSVKEKPEAKRGTRRNQLLLSKSRCGVVDQAHATQVSRYEF